MDILFENIVSAPVVSIVLLDWSCRESFHILDYLSEQTVPRGQYEVIWIEYYDRRSAEIKKRIDESIKLGKPPVVDKWIVMDMPKDVYYHKHLMYNIGIVAGKGKIVTICDSDAIVKPSFVGSIIKNFEEKSNVILHLDEVRNVDKKFYPFNYPSIEEITGKGCINWVNGKTTGVLEKKDPVHFRNYGACMCALRQDLIDIGGADEHIDYLGHICGPYELTFRLVNKGRKEVWHEEEYLYHVWHPGTDGLNNYLGPHDGKNVSSTALEAIKTKRILPLIENNAIKLIRLNKKNKVGEDVLFLELINDNAVKNWVIDQNKLLISLGRIAYFRKEYAEAVSHWKKVDSLSVFDSNFLAEFGWAYYFTAQYDEAIKIFLEAVRIDKNNQLALVGWGWACIQKGLFTEAKEILQKVVRNKRCYNSDTLGEAFRGLSIAKDSLRQMPFNHEKNRIGDFKGGVKGIVEDANLKFKFYSFKIMKRLRNRDFRIPYGLRCKIESGIFKRILNKAEKPGVNGPVVKGRKGEEEYITYGGYPCPVPTFSVQPNLDFLLLELPPRYLPMMPNGVAYVHNILMKCGIKFQTIDMNIVVYHKFHERRIREKIDSVITSSGYKLPEDPWDNTNMGEWDRAEVIDYFMPDIQRLLDEIASKKPKAVGLSLNGNNRILAKKFVGELRKKMPNIIIVVGGYDCVYYGLGQYLFPDFDYMLIGEAELTLEPLVKALAKGAKPKDLKGIVSRYDSPERVWEKSPLLQDLDSIDFPKYQWANHVWYQDCERKHLIPIAASRGCNWGRCRFCGECFPFRKRNPLKVVDEIEYYTKYGFHTFHFNESDVNGDPQTLYDLCSEIIKRNLTVKFVAQLRIDKRNTADYFKHLAKAGFTHLRFGVDGWTDNLLRLQNKGYNMGIVFQNLEGCHSAGITTTVNMVIGVPGETENDVSEAIENIIKCKNYISVVESFNTLLLICGSEYHRNPEKYKIRFRKKKNEIYSTYVHFVPAELWYSEEPYIDQDVRMRRLEKIISILHKHGVNIGSFASKVVEKLRSECEEMARV